MNLTGLPRPLYSTLFYSSPILTQHSLSLLRMRIFTRNNFTYADDVSWEKGRHDFRFGGLIEWSQVDLNNQFNQPGIINSCTQDTYPTAAFPKGEPAGLPTYQNFLAGIICDGGPAGNNYALQQGSDEFKANRDIFSGGYIQD